VIPDSLFVFSQDAIAGVLLWLAAISLAVLGFGLLAASWKNQSKRRYSF
jgi:hypothetical protein